ncbi:MAG: hypothetical protein ACE5O2_14720, partial [Armatimonadota bacterium]
MKTIGMITALLSLIGANGRPDNGAIALDNGYFRLRARDGRLTSLQVDPEGRGRYRPNWLIDMGFEGIVGARGARATHRANEVRFQRMVAETREPLVVEGLGVPARLEAGHTLGQTFEIQRGRAAGLEVHTPTWNTNDSSATLSLRRDGPDGELIARRRLVNVKDNSWQALTFEPISAGRYYVELSAPEGQIGWWSSRGRRYDRGEAYLDGRPLADAERALRVDVGQPVGEAEVRIALEGRRLKAVVRVSPVRGEQPRSWPLVMRLRWDNDGYDVSARTVPFFRFFADDMRYMPVEQLKRWRERGGRYEVSFGGSEWIEADGTGDYDVRFHGRGLGLVWHLRGKETTLRFSTTPIVADDAHSNEVVLEA